MERTDKAGIIFNIQKFSVHDGPGIRTTVFMKGCPLSCQWCSNAESMSPEPELGIIREMCNSCKKCLDVCPEDAIRLDNDVIQFDRERCTACGECAAVCPPGAITIYGRRVIVDEVFKEISKDKSFYEGSGGGITVSGGEPLQQADFVAALFMRCREESIDTCLDTCGCASAEALEKVLPFTGYVLFDIKHMDAEKHKQFTGVTNDLILRNAEIVANSGIQVLFRIPLIEGVNDTAENIEETGRFLKTLGNSAAIELLPYHRLGIGKYRTLDRPYPGKSFITPAPEKIEAVRQVFEENGIRCTVGG